MQSSSWSELRFFYLTKVLSYNLNSQQRLPARLHNARITVSKDAIKPVIDKSGKVPAQFPATRGEFEHLISKAELSLLVVKHLLTYCFRGALRRSFEGIWTTCHRRYCCKAERCPCFHRASTVTKLYGEYRMSCRDTGFLVLVRCDVKYFVS